MDFASITKLIIATIYYIIVGALAFFSAFAVYILLRYGRNLPVTVLVSVVYVIFFMTALASSYSALRAIQNF
jgi:fatty acid desaturase